MNSYIEWKAWRPDSFAKPTRHESAYFLKLMKLVKLKPLSRALEIGFGNGSFLGFARNQGLDIDGVELIPELVNLAKENGYKAHCSIDDIKKDEYDLIVMFDVLEHIDSDLIINELIKLKDLLATNGKILIRTPNGASPFGLANQHGDITHITVVTESKVAYWAKESGLRLTSTHIDPFPFIWKHKLTKAPSKILKFLTYKSFEKLIRFISPQSKGILSSNILFVLE